MAGFALLLLAAAAGAILFLVLPALWLRRASPRLAAGSRVLAAGVLLGILVSLVPRVLGFSTTPLVQAGRAAFPLEGDLDLMAGLTLNAFLRLGGGLALLFAYERGLKHARLAAMTAAPPATAPLAPIVAGAPHPRAASPRAAWEPLGLAAGVGLLNFAHALGWGALLGLPRDAGDATALLPLALVASGRGVAVASLLRGQVSLSLMLGAVVLVVLPLGLGLALGRVPGAGYLATVALAAAGALLAYFIGRLLGRIKQELGDERLALLAVGLGAGLAWLADRWIGL